MKPFLGLLFLVLTISACSNGGGGGGGIGGAGEGPTDALNSCNNVITEDAITSFNNKQTEFRVAGSGYSVQCKAEVNVNGRITKVEKKGRSDIRIYPKVQFMDVQEISRTSGVRYQLHLNIPKVQPDEVKRILKSLAVQPNESKLQYDEFLDLPAYLRFKKGTLDLMKQTVSWLIYDLYFSKSDSMQKGETYLINGRMTKQSFAALKAEYSKLYNGHLSKQEALTQAEKNVLGI